MRIDDATRRVFHTLVVGVLFIIRSVSVSRGHVSGSTFPFYRANVVIVFYFNSILFVY